VSVKLQPEAGKKNKTSKANNYCLSLTERGKRLTALVHLKNVWENLYLVVRFGVW